MEPHEILRGTPHEQRDANEFAIEREHLLEACERLKNAGFEHLNLITAIDWKKRWEVLYHLTQFGRKELVVLRVELPYKDPVIPSIVELWPGAGWHERETYDLMGIRFEGNPDLRRILMPQDYKEHPLRKEVPFGNIS